MARALVLQLAAFGGFAAAAAIIGAAVLPAGAGLAQFAAIFLLAWLACRAAHVASLAGPDGTLLWRGRSFFTRPADLESCGGIWPVTRPS